MVTVWLVGGHEVDLPDAETADVELLPVKGPIVPAPALICRAALTDKPLAVFRWEQIAGYLVKRDWEEVYDEFPPQTNEQATDRE